MNAGTGKLAGQRLIFYNDAKGFGGHEIQALHALRWMLREGAEVSCYYRAGNEAHQAALMNASDLGTLKMHPLELPAIRFHRPFHLFHPELVRSLAGRFQEENHTAAFIAQGNLEISAPGALAAKQAGIPCLSYIPITHRFVELGINKPRRRDLFNGYLATVPDRWLTISEAMRERLRQRGARQPIDLIPNCITLTESPDKRAARRALGLPEDACVLGMAGRLDRIQKGTNVFLDALAGFSADHPIRQAWILLLGDGPEKEGMLTNLKKQGWEGRILWQPWTDTPERIYPAFDLLVMPSRFEGLPITMQEALVCGVPIAASNVDGLGEFLPSEWTCPRNNPEALRELLESFAQNSAAYCAPLPSLAEHVRREHNREAFEETLADSLHNLLAQKGIAD